MPEATAPTGHNLAEYSVSELAFAIKRTLETGFERVRVKGEISGCERLQIDGQVDAALSDVKTIEVTASGQFKGTAEVESAVIAGLYEGTLKVSGHLEVASTGAIKGSVSYKTIMVANGGKLEGTIEST